MRVVGAVVVVGALAASAHAEKLTLAQAYQLALKNSDRVGIAEANVREQQIRTRERWNDVSPIVNIEGSGAFQRETLVNMNVLRPADQVIIGAHVVQPVFRKGFFDSVTAAERRGDSAAATLGREREQLARDVMEAYIDVIQARALRDHAKDAVQRAQGQYDHAIARVTAGSALKTAELLAQVDLQRAQRQAMTVQGEVGVAEAAFRRLVGTLPPADLELPAIPRLPDSAQGQAHARQRGDLRALELTAKAASADTDAARGKRFWPRLDIDAGVQRVSPPILDYTVDWHVTGLLTIPLFDAGREYTDIRLRANDERVANLELEQQRKVVTEEVERSAVLVKTTSDAYDFAKKELDAANEHYKLIDKQFRLGAITFLEVTNGQAVLVEAENAYEIAKDDRVRAAYEYLFAIGALDLSALSE